MRDGGVLLQSFDGYGQNFGRKKRFSHFAHKEVHDCGGVFFGFAPHNAYRHLRCHGGVPCVRCGARLVFVGGDVFLLLVDVFLLTSFGTALSSVVNVFLKTQGQASGVGTIVSAGYGFICGAYMPIASFSKGLQNFISLLPGTYGTALMRNHALRGVYEEMSSQGFPSEVVEAIKDSVDCNIYFFGDKVSEGAMYGVLVGAIVVLVAAYVLINYLTSKSHRSIEDIARKTKRKSNKD